MYVLNLKLKTVVALVKKNDPRYASLVTHLCHDVE
jgi:hypothetical protein